MRIIRDIKKYLSYSIVAAKAQLESEVANSYLNWLWWIIEPLCMMFVYAFIFGTVFNIKEKNHALFIFIGLMMYDFFSRSVKSSIKIVKRNKQIVTKVYIPKFILIISELLVNGFKMLMCLIVTFAMMIIYKIPFTWHIILLIPIFIALFLFTFSICTYLTHLGVFVEDLSNVVNIILRLLFYFTGVFYSIKTKFPEPYGKIVLRFYPVSKLIDYTREVLLYANNINFLYLLALMLGSIVLSIIGIYIIYKNENTYVKMI